LQVHEVRLDCDGDAVLYTVTPAGPTCHTGRTSCFYKPIFRDDGQGPRPHEFDDGPPAVPGSIVSRLAEIIAKRKSEPAENSYVASLLHKGYPKIAGKIAEETAELHETIDKGDRQHAIKEAADILFHALVGFEAAHVAVEDVFAELERRFGVSGHVEKAARKTR
jgi:phosphoribosyl-ATP pyrophosphohydrolase/phosphoribosyl-AMP cyclohydrolase